MRKKNTALLNELENRFADYQNIPLNIRKQKNDIIMQHQDTPDENIGGGSSNRISNPTEREVLSYVDDPYIAEQLKSKRAIEETLSELSEDERELIERKYWGDCSWMNWKEFANKVNYSPASMSRLKQKTLLKFGRKINRIGSWNEIDYYST